MANYVRFQRHNGSIAYGRRDGETVSVLSGAPWAGGGETGETVALGDVRLLTPTEPRSVVCVGLNYRSHLGGREVPDPPTLFFKPLSSLAGPGDVIELPAGAETVEPEGEIVIVIGTAVSKPSLEEAEAAIFGYTAGNDVSAREWQAADGQWWRAKGSDTFGVYGPEIVTGLAADAVEVWTELNGEEVQRGGSDELIIPIVEIVRYVAGVISLVPGDVIYTGTPGKPRAIVEGDEVSVFVTGCLPLVNGVSGEA